MGIDDKSVVVIFGEGSDNGFSVFVKKYGKTSAIACCMEYVVYTCYSIHPYFRNIGNALWINFYKPLESIEPEEPEIPIDPEIPEEPDIPIVPSNTKKLANIYQGMSFNKVLEEIIKLLPILLLILISFIGIRKGISLLFSLLRYS